MSKNLYSSTVTLFDAGIIYDQNEETTQDLINADVLSTISGKVSKSGDIMTGTLDVGTSTTSDAQHLRGVVINTTIDTDSSPSSNTWWRGYSVNDVDDTERAYLSAYDLSSNGEQGVQIETKRVVNGTAVYNGLRLGLDSSGTKNVTISDPAAWRSALGAVSKAGDTMTGNLSFNKTTPVIAMQNTEVEHNSAPSANKDVADIIHYYKGGQIAGYYITRKDSTGDAYNIMLSRNYSGSTAYDNYLRLNVSSTGVKSVGVSDPAAWRTAIFSDTGWTTFPLSSNFEAFGSNYVPKYRVINGICYLSGIVKPKTTLTYSGGPYTIGTLPTGARPTLTEMYFMGQSNGQRRFDIQVTNSGNVKIDRYGVTSGEDYGAGQMIAFTVQFPVG